MKTTIKMIAVIVALIENVASVYALFFIVFYAIDKAPDSPAGLALVSVVFVTIPLMAVVSIVFPWYLIDEYL